MYDIIRKGKDIDLAWVNGKAVLQSKEIECKCTDPRCHFTIFHPSVGRAFGLLRERYGKPIRITSGFRCQSHNLVVGGVEKSFHTVGMALDMLPFNYDDESERDAELDKIERFARDYFKFVIRYETFVHADVRKQ